MNERVSKIEKRMDEILDVLITEGGYFTGPWGGVLVKLTETITGEPVDRPLFRDGEYQATSAAVVRLETIGLLAVDRAHRDESAKANIVEAIRLL